MTRLTGVLACLLACVPGIAGAVTVRLCTDQSATTGSDARLLNHLPYGEARPETLTPAPAGFAVSGTCLVRIEVAADLARLLAAADAVPEVAGRIRGVSCFRSIALQDLLFCGDIGPGRGSANAAARARLSAPPGYSEHATGYALDFGTRPSDCPDAEACFAVSAAGRWLLANAPRFGFELSFPAGNRQGVSWEPWHWRWVGMRADATGARAARTQFATARRRFPALPTTADSLITVERQPVRINWQRTELRADQRKGPPDPDR